VNLTNICYHFWFRTNLIAAAGQPLKQAFRDFLEKNKSNLRKEIFDAIKFGNKPAILSGIFS